MYGLYFAYYLTFLSLFDLRISYINGAKILAIFPYSSLSQRILFTPYLRALAARGHALTVIHAYPNAVELQNVRYISVYDEGLNYLDWDFNIFNTQIDKWQQMNIMTSFVIKCSLNVLNNAEVKALLRSNATFDLVIMEPGQTEALYGFARHFNTPLLGISSCGSDWNIDYLVGYITSTIYEPLLPVGYTAGLTFWERLYNLAVISEEWLLINLIFLPQQKKLIEEYFPEIDESIDELRSNFSLILLNQHFTLGQPRPNVPSLIEVGGMHLPLDTPPPLSNELAQFINEARHGVIYVSFGSQNINIFLSMDILNVLASTFSHLKQRVIWKNGIAIDQNNKTDNIYIAEWLPQLSILAHPNVKLFITHGGLLSIIEAVNYAKPIIGLPMFYDQFMNIERLVEAGVAASLDISTLHVESTKAAIENVIEDVSYSRNALVLSKRFRDQPMPPMDTAIYWTEYILRHKGAPYMRIQTKKFKFTDYYSVDKILMLCIRFGFTAVVLVFITYRLARCIFFSQ